MRKWLARGLGAVVVVIICSSCEMLAKISTEPMPTADAGFVQLPFQKLVNPAFIDEVQGRWVQTEAAFGGVMNIVVDLPKRFHADYVRFALYDANSPSPTGMATCVIQKDKSDPLFALAPNAKVRVFGLCVPTVTTYQNIGRSQQSFVLEVERIEKSP